MNGKGIPPVRALTVAALLLVVIGIGVQILAWADYPPVPPGAVILVIAAGVRLMARRWWAPVIAAIQAIGQCAAGIGSFP